MKKRSLRQKIKANQRRQRLALASATPPAATTPVTTKNQVSVPTPTTPVAQSAQSSLAKDPNLKMVFQDLRKTSLVSLVVFILLFGIYFILK